MGSTEKPTAAFVLSLLAGIFIFIGLFIEIWIGSVIAQFADLSDVPGFVFEILRVGWWVGWIRGAIVLLAAFMLFFKPAQARAWGIVVLVLSILSIFTLGFITVILGIIGGALAISWKPAKT